MKKDGPNKGREFYKCAKQQPCNFFAWADANGPNTSYRGGEGGGGGGGGGGGTSTYGGNYQNPSRNNGNDGGNTGQGEVTFIFL